MSTKNTEDRKKIEKELRVLLRNAKDFDLNEIDIIYKIENILKRVQGGF